MLKITMDFISLPDVFKLQILEELHWRDLNNLKLVCKDLYFIVVENIEKLDKPKVDYIHIYYSKDKIMGAYYALKHTENRLRSDTFKTVEFDDDHEYECFLKNKDFTEIKILVFENRATEDIISIRDSDYDTCGIIGEIELFHEMNLRFRKYCFYNVNDYRFHIAFFNRESEPLEITISSTEELRIQCDGNVLRKDSLRKWGLFEENGIRSVGKKIVTDLLTGNSLLEYENVSADINTPNFIQVTNHLYELGLFNLENLCNRKRIQLSFTVDGGFTVSDVDFYIEFFDMIKFNGNFVVENYGEQFYIWSSIDCSKCGVRHRNTMTCRKSPEIGTAYVEIALANSILSMDVEYSL
uniref:F-box domain-containing protein n=1 Tax=Strongyloides venezuelensis TaxID=75913 RepID=A0A0K0G303_STRVS